MAQGIVYRESQRNQNSAQPASATEANRDQGAPLDIPLLSPLDMAPPSRRASPYVRQMDRQSASQTISSIVYSTRVAWLGLLKLEGPLPLTRRSHASASIAVLLTAYYLLLTTVQVHPRFCINGCALDFQERQGAAAAPTE